MPKQGDDLRLLKAAADLVADAEPPTSEEAREELRAAGIDPDKLGRSLRQRLVQRTWATIAERNTRDVEQATSGRRPRPPEKTKEVLLPLVLKHPRRAELGITFRNAEDQSADDLWDALCDLDALDELD